MKKSLASLLFSLFFVAQFFAQTLVGKVLDDAGEPLPFASVFVQNSTNGTTANAEGEFRLSLEKGTHRVVFQYVGFKQKIETVEITGEKPVVRLTVRMESNALEIGEVVVLANAEDPAYGIMREVIARRKQHKKWLPEYACDAYVKGLYKMLDAPKKLLGKDVGNMGGALDSNRTGIVYLSESVSKMYVQAAPARKKEVMISSKVSGDPNGFSLNRATLTDFSLYDEHIEVERDILSPLADNAFSYYRFRLVGRFKDQNGHEIAKIEVIPKRETDPVFGGFLYVVDGEWCLQGADLVLTGAAIHQPVLDTLRIAQEFVPMGTGTGWALLSQVTTFKFGIFGFKIGGFFNSVFSNYDLKPAFPAGLFSNEVFKIEEKAAERDSSYWEKIRPMPLTEEESRDYVKKDSLRRVVTSKAYLDSVDRVDNKYKLVNFFFGYTYSKSFERLDFSVPSAFRWVQFNTVQGGLLNIEPSLRKEGDERATHFWEVNGRLNYGFAEKRLRGDAGFRRRFNSVNFAELRLAGGLKTEQFNENQPISPLINTSYSLFGRRNYMKIYEKVFAEAQFSREIRHGIFGTASLEWADRRLLENHSDYSWSRKTDRQYTPNDPVPTEGREQLFVGGRAFFAELRLRFRFAQEYLSYPKQKVYGESKWPDLTVIYRKAVPNVAGSTADFDFLMGQFRQTGLGFGIAGHTSWTLAGGTFLRAKNLQFMDFRHFLGNQTQLGNPSNYTRGFFMLPYYDFSTDGAFAQAHAQHHFEGYFLDKIPGIRKLGWKEVLGFNVLWTDKGSLVPTETARPLPYWELNFGFENIGVGAFRMGRLDVVANWFGGNFERVGVVFGADL